MHLFRPTPKLAEINFRLMNIALVFNAMDGPDSTASSLSTSEHLGIGYLAASLRSKGHSVLLVNSEVQGLDTDQTFMKTIDFLPQVVGCSPVSLSINNTLDLLKRIKEYDCSIYTVLGGHLASMCAEDIISAEPFVDYILKGDAEFSVLNLLERISSKDPDMIHVPGLVFRDQNGNAKELALTGSYHKLDDYPICHRDDLAMISGKDNFDGSARILASRGCFYKCSFCTTPNFYGKTVRFRDYRCVISEMNELNERYKVTHFWFNDDLFVNSTPENTEWIERFTQGLLENPVKYSYRVLCRADSFKRKNHHLLDRMIETGLSHIFFGLESGSQKSLEIYNKKATVAHNRSAIELIRSKNVQLQIGFIMYNPYSTLQELIENAHFLFEIGELYRWFPLTRPLSVFPGTMISKRLESDGMLISNSYREPLTCYTYQDKKVGYLADLMYRFYNDNSSIDRMVNRTLKEKSYNDESRDLTDMLSQVNLRCYLSLVHSVRSRNHDDYYADSVTMEAWLSEIKEILERQRILK